MAMYVRSDSLILSISTSSSHIYQDPFAFRSMPRRSEPEIFTFEQAPIEATQRSASHRHRRKNTRVMYPSKVRKYLPPAEKSLVKRWLIILCLVVCLQIYTEEAYNETSSGADSSAADASSQELSLAQYQILPFQSAEQQAHKIKSFPADPQEGQAQHPSGENWTLNFLSTMCPSTESDLLEQSRRNSYVVALLYPVYHRLGSDN